MMQICFKHYYICIFYITLQVKYSISDENVTTRMKPSPEERFEDKSYDCDGVRKLDGIKCNREPVEGKEVFKLTFNDSKILPAKIFLGYNISRSVLNDPDLDVDENVFEGMVTLKDFDVLRSNIKVIPDFSFVKHSIRNISIQSSLLTSLAGKNLQNLTKLSYMSFRYNLISFIDPDVFKGTENMFYMDLSYNRLTFIPPKLLDPMKKLRYFGASHNTLLHVDNLFSVTQPNNIFLHFNNITDIYPILLLNNEKLKKFVNARTGSNSENLDIHRCENLTETLSTFKIIYEIELLDLSYNSIKETSRPFSPCYWNNIDGYNFRTKILTLRGNKVQSLNKLLGYSIINRLSLSRNQIQYLTKRDFSTADETQGIQINENEIRWIDTDTFRPMSLYLKHLDLGSNYITSINGSIRYLAQLEFLNMSNNLIQFFARDEFTGLNRLSQLHLQNNQIKSLGNLQQLPQLTYINIAENDIELIRPEQVPTTLRYIHLSDNPFRCDCQLQPFIDRFKKDDSFSANTELCLQSDIIGNSIQKLTTCPDMCSCKCNESGGVSFMFVDCSSKNLTAIPQFTRNNSTDMEGNETRTSYYENLFVIQQNINPLSYMEDRVMGINLENNNLESLDVTQLPPNLTQLYLSNNKLRWLPETIFENQLNLKQVSLSGNPWICDCNTLKFKRWLTSKNDIIRDINNVRCRSNSGGDSKLNARVIWTLTDLELCPTDIALIVSLPVGILVFITLGLIAILLYNKYNLNIKIFLYSHGFTFVKEEDLDHDKIFDAFISFSNHDGEFVTREIIEGIESRDPNISLCVHYRNFLAGEFIYDNIIRAVKISKRTFLILSRNFLDSEWCLLEFRTAHIQALEDKVHRIIVIKIGDLPNEINPTIKAYLDCTTYLTWGEKNFWNKLFYVLPSRKNVKNFIPNNARDNEDVLNCLFSEV